MLRHLGLIAVCACIVASIACEGEKWIASAPSPLPAPVQDRNTMVTVEFGGRVVNADGGGPVANVQVSLGVLSSSMPNPDGWVIPRNTATSAEDGLFALPLNLPGSWQFVSLQLTAPPGYDETEHRVEPKAAADRPAIGMYPTLVIRPGESIHVRVDDGIVRCVWGVGTSCRRVLVTTSPDDPVELEIVPHDSSKPMTLTPGQLFEPDMSVRRLMVPPGGVAYVIGTGTATLTARR
jgi:hypothetical protein